MNNVEDIYALSPMQELMLLHSLSRPNSEVLFNQFLYTVRGDVDVDVIRESWQKIVDRHPALRTAFAWEDVKRPLQFVRRTVDLPFQELDLSGLPADRQQSRLADFRRQDRERGFDFCHAPLMRVAVLRLGQADYRFMWSSHHLVMDRWCLPIIHHEFLSLYKATVRREPENLQRPVPYRRYLTWVRQQDEQKAKEFWQRTLRGFTTPTYVSPNSNPESTATMENGIVSEMTWISEETSAALRKMSQQNSLTVATLFFGAWALVMSELTGCPDVTYGVTVSGRPSDLNGVESIVGSFINNVPMRVRCSRETPLLEYLKNIQTQDHNRRPFEYVSAGKIHEWSDLTQAQPLFDTLVVFNSGVEIVQDQHDDLQFLAHAGETRTAAGLTVAVSEEKSQMFVSMSSPRLGKSWISATLQRLFAKLELFVEHAGQSLAIPIGNLLSADRQPVKALEPVKDASDRLFSSHDDVPRSRRRRNLKSLETEAQQQLLRHEWQIVLGTNGVGLDNDFFHLGGTSLLALQLHSRVEMIMGKGIPLVHLFRSPTINGMVKTIQEQDWPIHRETLVPIQPEGTKPPLYCIASPDVNPIGYTLLARHLGKHQPTFLVQSPDTSDQRMMPQEISARASAYLDAIKSDGQSGPYQLLGMCDGAYLAFEIARQLRSGRDQVSFVAIVNTWAINTVSRLYYLQRYATAFGWYARRLNWLWQLSKDERRTALRESLGRKASRMSRRLSVKNANTSNSERNEEPSDPWLAAGLARQSAPTEKYPGRVTVFRIRKQQYWRTWDRDLGWGRHAEEVDVRFLPAKEHLRILHEPEVNALAQEITACLSTASK